MNFLQTSYELHTNFLCSYYKLFMNFLQTSFELLTNFLCSYYKLFMNLLQTSLDKMLSISPRIQGNSCTTFVGVTDNFYKVNAAPRLNKSKNGLELNAEHMW